eukprot:CAMPEP_0119010814 /NCGR_PEP_ID=MMETSP1176-20130426/5263_1 /TAXON_ID=265551 /ORGANISM="Synedropsis recta cf, Strain CCMP1620" /LENGTH=198 /DNA_ID=CAMNT_0006963553 /DNA_START=55 /DNA_END=651 /DNA_ORIENTATION=+
MKTAVAFLTVVAGASAFAPAASNSRSTAIKAATEFENLPGIDIETGKKFFDPLNLSEWIPAEHARKAELSNGRSAMLATVGWFWPAKVGMFASDDVTTTDPVDAIMQADPQWWAQFVIFCGVIEAIKYRAEQDGGSFTGEGDPAIDYMNQWGGMNDAQKETMRLKELKNARLAMIGFASFVSAHFIPGSVPGLPADFH